MSFVSQLADWNRFGWIRYLMRIDQIKWIEKPLDKWMDGLPRQ